MKYEHACNVGEVNIVSPAGSGRGGPRADDAQALPGAPGAPQARPRARARQAPAPGAPG